MFGFPRTLRFIDRASELATALASSNPRVVLVDLEPDGTLLNKLQLHRQRHPEAPFGWVALQFASDATTEDLRLRQGALDVWRFPISVERMRARLEEILGRLEGRSRETAPAPKVPASRSAFLTYGTEIIAAPRLFSMLTDARQIEKFRGFACQTRAQLSVWTANSCLALRTQIDPCDFPDRRMRARLERRQAEESRAYLELLDLPDLRFHLRLGITSLLWTASAKDLRWTAAGFDFPLPSKLFELQRRRHLRWSPEASDTSRKASLVSDGRRFSPKLLDVSGGGAQIFLPASSPLALAADPHSPSPYLMFRVEDQAFSVSARAVWTRPLAGVGALVGLRFERVGVETQSLLNLRCLEARARQLEGIDPLRKVAA